MALAPNNPFVRDRLTWLAYIMLAYMAFIPAMLSPLMPFLRKELNLSYTMGGLLSSALAVGMILAGLTSDRVAHRWGRRFAFWSGGIGLTMSALCLALSSQVVLTITAVLSMGYFGSLTLAMIQAILSDRHGAQRAIALTESNVAASASTTLAPLFVGGFQSVGVGWRGALYLAAALFALIAARFFKDPVPDIQPPTLGSNPGGRQKLPHSFWVYWIVICLVVSIEWCLVIWGADYLENVVGLSKTNASTMMGVFFAAMLIGRFMGSRMTRVMPSTILLLIALGVTMVGFPVFWLARFAPLNIVGLFVAGLGVANLFPLSLSVAVGAAPQQTTTASARVSLGVGTAVLLAPLTLGWTADRVGLQNAYGIEALLLVIATMVILFSSRIIAVRWLKHEKNT
ncbi:MAG: MFS transporter [Chloroflexi bacterium]|nr:MFS transporter [Chloroflexota bacterium]